MYHWRWNQGREMTQWTANNMPCNYHEGMCNAPYCPRWRDVSKAYFIKTDEGKLGKAEFVELMGAENMGYCQ